MTMNTATYKHTCASEEASDRRTQLHEARLYLHRAISALDVALNQASTDAMHEAAVLSASALTDAAQQHLVAAGEYAWPYGVECADDTQEGGAK